MTRIRSTKALLTAALIAVSSGHALAQADGKQAKRERQRQKQLQNERQEQHQKPHQEHAQDAAPLGGPKVRTNTPPGGGDTLVEKERKYQTRGAPLRLYAAELRKMAAASADDSIRLSDKQAQEIRSITVAHMEAVRAHAQNAGQQAGRRRQAIGEEQQQEMLERRERLRERRQSQQNGAQNSEQSDRAKDRRQSRQRGTDQRSTDQQVDAPRRGQRQFSRDAAPQRDDQPRGARRGTAKRGSDAHPQSDRPRDAAQSMSPEDRRAARERAAELRSGGPDDQAAVKKIWALLNDSQREHLAKAVEERHQRMVDERIEMNAAEEVDIEEARKRARERLEQMSPEERRDALERMRERREGRTAGDGAERGQDQPPQQRRRGARPQSASPDSDG